MYQTLGTQIRISMRLFLNSKSQKPLEIVFVYVYNHNIICKHVHILYIYTYLIHVMDVRTIETLYTIYAVYIVIHLCLSQHQGDSKCLTTFAL